MIETEYRGKQSKVGCGVSIHFAEHVCVRKNPEKDDNELLVKNHQTPPYRMNFNIKKLWEWSAMKKCLRCSVRKKLNVMVPRWFTLQVKLLPIVGFSWSDLSVTDSRTVSETKQKRCFESWKFAISTTFWIIYFVYCLIQKQLY